MNDIFETNVELWRRGLFDEKNAFHGTDFSQKLFDEAKDLAQKASLQALTALYDDLYPREDFPIKEIRVNHDQVAYAISFQGYVIGLRVVVRKTDDEPYIEDFYSDGKVIRGHEYRLWLNMVHRANRAPVSFRSTYFLPQGAGVPIVQGEFPDDEVSLKLFELFSLFEYLSFMYHSS